MARRIAITGVTGLIGSALAQTLLDRGDAVVGFSRTAQPPAFTHPHYTHARWQRTDPAALTDALTGCDTVVNLMGASIAGARWTPSYKQRLHDTRVAATDLLVAACAALPQPPRAFISASGSGFYGYRDLPAAVDETTPAGTDFLAALCVDWEAAALRAAGHGMRVALVRTAVVLDAQHGALPQMAMPFRFWVGGPVGSGRQPVPWIHRDDIVRLYCWLIDSADASGPYNAVAPDLVDNRRFSQSIAQVLGRPCWLLVPAFALRLVFGELADALLLNGQPMQSSRVDAQQVGYRYPTLVAALRDLWQVKS